MADFNMIQFRQLTVESKFEIEKKIITFVGKWPQTFYTKKDLFHWTPCRCRHIIITRYQYT